MRFGIGSCLTALFILTPALRAEIVFRNANPDYELYQPVAPGEEIGDDEPPAGPARYIPGFSAPTPSAYTQPSSGAFPGRFYEPDAAGLPGRKLGEGTATLANQAPGDAILTF